MTPTPLSAAELDQILRDNIHTRNGIEWIKNEDLGGVVASHRLLAERLAEAEDRIANLLSMHSAGEKVMESTLNELNNRLTASQERETQRRLHLEASVREAKDLRAQLAAMTADRDRYKEMNPGALAVGLGLKGIELSKEHAARQAAEARTAELVHFASNDGRLGAYLNTVIDDLQIDGKGQYFRDLFGEFSKEMAALATTDTGAIAVLAAADEFIALDDKLKGTYKDAINGSWVGNLEVLRQAVHARLAARGEGGAGG